MRKSATPEQEAAQLKFRAEFPLNSIVIQDYGKYPDTIVATLPGEHVVNLVAPNGRIYQVRLEGNSLRVNSREGGILVKPQAANVVEVINLTSLERAAERGLDG